MARRSVLLDACVAINLIATDHLADIAQSLEIGFLMTRQAAGEVGHLRDIDGGDIILTPIDLTKYATGSALKIIDLAPGEYPLYIELAAIVDDGEASTIAVAATRNLPLATDDRKAHRLCEEKQIQEPMRTLALIHDHCEAVGLDETNVCDLLMRIRDRASFFPPRSDPDYKWWSDIFAAPAR